MFDQPQMDPSLLEDVEALHAMKAALTLMTDQVMRYEKRLAGRMQRAQSPGMPHGFAGPDESPINGMPQYRMPADVPVDEGLRSDVFGGAAE